MKYDLYVTTPIYYVNSNPHIGHTYTTVVADIMKRYYALFGKKVYFLTGTDEHGEKIETSAEKHGKAPQVFVDEISQKYRDLWKDLNISNDDFIRTTEERHKKVVNFLLDKLYKTGDIYFGSYEGKYCVGCERFLTDAEMVDGVCKDHKVAPKISKEENYFFKMEKYRIALKDYIEKTPDLIRPDWYRKEVLGYLSEDIGDLCISRPKDRISWGIELPFDKKFVTYVWFDALINYLSAIGYPNEMEYKEKWSVCEHLIAKDILRTHTVYWGTMLIAAGIPMYKHLNVHGYWMMGEGLKMSKSLGNVIDPYVFKKTYGYENLRYFYLREMRWGDDSDFNLERFIGRYNSDLANNYGNLISRSLGMMEKYFKDAKLELYLNLPKEHPLKEKLEAVKQSYVTDFRNYQFNKTLELMWNLFDETNKYIADSKPWEIFKKGNIEELYAILYPVVEVLRITAFMLSPVMPSTAEEILRALGIELKEVKDGFDTFTQWGSVKEIKPDYSKKIFFTRIEETK